MQRAARPSEQRTTVDRFKISCTRIDKHEDKIARRIARPTDTFTRWEKVKSENASDAMDDGS